MPDNYTPPDNDYLSSALEDLVPTKYKGTEKFLDVVTWNICWFHDRDPERVRYISDVLEALNADIIVLQEIKEASLRSVAVELQQRNAGYYEDVYGTTGGNQRVAMLYDLDWIRAKDDFTELFGKGSIVTPDGKDAFPRLPFHGYFTGLASDNAAFDFQLIGLHLKSQMNDGTYQRQMAADALANWLIKEAPRVDSDVIMLGDWNKEPDQPEWGAFHKLEKEGKVAFQKLNDGDSISHLMYQNQSKIGSRLDLTAVSMSAYKNLVKKKNDVVRWKSLDDLLDSNPKAAQVKAFLKILKTKVSDHLPVVTRFYFEDK